MAKTSAPKRSLAERIADADAPAGRWISEGNEAEDVGNHEKLRPAMRNPGIG